MNKKYRISAVSYLNTLPFMYGLENHSFLKKADVSLDYPSECAKKLLNDKADIGLVPVAVLPSIKGHKIISDYCIGSHGSVRSVILYSKSPIELIKSVRLDYQSGTSVKLVKVLAKKHWKIDPLWIQAEPGYENICLEKGEAAVIIGDRAFSKEDEYPFIYDLSEEWFRYTGLPFVFATWTANKKIEGDFIKDFNKALSFGVANTLEAVKNISKDGLLDEKELYTYLTKNISYKLDNDKMSAIERFLNVLKDLDK